MIRTANVPSVVLVVSIAFLVTLGVVFSLRQLPERKACDKVCAAAQCACVETCPRERPE